MAEWIDEVDRIDRSLHRLGVPPGVRIKAVAEIMTILAEAEKAKRDRRQLVLEAVNKHRGNVERAANEVGWSRSTCYAELRSKTG